MQSVNRTKYTLAQLIIFIVINCLTNLATADELPVRNPFNAKNMIGSEHFAYWYSDEFIGQEDKFNQVLQRLEFSWQELVTVRGYPAPLDNYKLNVYLEEAGGTGVPYDFFTGQALIDDQGYPFIMFNRILLDYEPVSAHLLVTHEFFHTLQYAYGNDYGPYRDDATWFMEASAGCAALEVWKEEQVLAKFIWSLAPTPHLSVNHDERKGASSAEASAANIHHYAMITFLYYVSQATDPLIIKKTLEHMSQQILSNTYLDALAVLEYIANESYGIELATLFNEYAAKNILWDHSQQTLFTDTQTELNISQSSRALATHNITNNKWIYPQNTDSPGLPRSWGASYLHFSNTDVGQVEFSFQSEAKNSNNLQWQITLVTPTEPIQYQTIDVIDGAVEKHLIDIGDENEFWLSITPIGPTNNTSTQYDFAYQLAEVSKSTPYQKEPQTITEKPRSSSGGAIMFLAIMCWLTISIRLIVTLLNRVRKVEVQGSSLNK